MMKRVVIFYLCVLLFFIACTESTPANKARNEPVVDANEAYYNSIKHLTGLEFQPRIQKADSVEVIFYTNPDGDPKRYTRFYNWLPSADSNLVLQAKSSIDKKFTRIEHVKDCRSEGKIYFFAGENPMQTVYFSNRGDSCRHLYFINDGWFFYMDMDGQTARFLDSLKPLATRPPGDGRAE